MFRKAEAIFPKGKRKEKNFYCLFTAKVGSLQNCRLSLAVSGFYKLYVNGVFVSYGPARTAKGYARVDTFDLSSFTGEENRLTVAVENPYCGSYYTPLNKGFFIAELTRENEVIAYTGRDFDVYLSPAKMQKTMRYAYQRHFSECWDLRAGWGLFDGAEKTEWEKTDAPVLIPRRAPYPDYTYVSAPFAVTAGDWVFDESLPHRAQIYSVPITEQWGCFPEDDITYKPFTVVESHKEVVKRRNVTYPVTISAGEYAMFDLGHIEAGFLHGIFSAKGDADLILAFTEDATPEKFDFTALDVYSAFEILLSEGDNQPFTTFDPYTARYMMIAVQSGNITVSDMGVIRYAHKTDTVKVPDFGDETLNAIYRGAVRTFSHNAVDLYTDCPSRERAGWLCDSYFSGKAEKFLFNDSSVEDAFLENYRLFKNDGIMEEGAVPMCYPAVFDGTFIPQWTMWLVLQIEEYCGRSQNAKAEDFRSLVEGLLSFYKRYENSDGLLEKLPSWNFVEWSRANQLTQDVNYPTNFLYAGVLDAAYRLYGVEAYKNRAEEVRKTAKAQSFNGTLFRDHAACQADGTLAVLDDITEVCQYYAVLFGNVDRNDAKYKEFYRYITEVFTSDRTTLPEIEKINAFIGVYLRLEALDKLGEYKLLLSDIRDFFGEMERETGTLWEHRERFGSFDHGFASYAAALMTKAYNILH